MSSIRGEIMPIAQEGRDKATIFTCYLAALATLSITPFNSFDPINVVKFFIVCIAGFGGLFVVLQDALNFRHLPKNRKRYLLLSGFVSISMLITFIAKSSPISQALYGAYGRNTGLLASFSLVLIAFLGAKAQSQKTLDRAYFVFLLTGTAVAIYCLFQYFGIDPIDWNSTYSPIFGTLGNPNFASAFIGMTGSAALVLLFSIQKIVVKVCAGAYILVAFFITVVSESWQGTALLLIAIATLVLIQIHRLLRKRFISVTFFLIVLTLGIFSFLGLLGKGPLGATLQKGTLSIRLDYWRTAISAIRDNWLFGIGIDGFGEVFRKYRDQETLDRIGPNVFTNSAHNVYLDFALSYGVIALIFMICLKLFVLRTAIINIRAGNYSVNLYLGLFFAWIAYEIQALISINQLGVGVWGWLLAGLLCGGATKKENREVKQYKAPGRAASKSSKKSEYQSLVWFSGAVLGMLVALPAFVADGNFRTSMESQKLDQIVKATKAFPADAYRIAYMVRLLDRAKLDAPSVELTKFGLEKFPLNYDLNLLRTLLPGFSFEEKKESEIILAELDPLVNGKP